MSKTRKELEAIVEALDDAPIDEAEARATVAELGIDVGALAAKLRQTVASADARDREQRYQAARIAYAAEIERLERRRVEPKRTREEQVGIYQALLARAPREAVVAMHFHKYETATDEELAELIRSLRHLLGEEDEPDDPE